MQRCHYANKYRVYEEQGLRGFYYSLLLRRDATLRQKLRRLIPISGFTTTA